MDVDQLRRQVRTLRALQGPLVAHVHPDEAADVTEEVRTMLDSEGVRLVVTEWAEPGLTLMAAGE